ncbi:MAG: STAS/SEC14 domain-containing protein [Verrucomicrobiaceae bacterium]|nr:MAG: STAS/SEC14 domain-containing protein [Verrucomicrobiaceae bacterium]
MIHFEFHREQGILCISPQGPLQSADFQTLASAVDPFIETEGDLKGLLIDAPAFPGWQSFGDMISHFQFVKNHIRHIRKVAVVSDSNFLSVMPRFVGHFIHAEVKHFGGRDKEQAMTWLAGDGGAA